MDDGSIGCLIHQTANCIDNYLSNYMLLVAKTVLTPMESMTLRIIYQKYKETVFTAADLMQITFLSKSTTSQTLNSLLKKGFIKMETVSEDKRKKIIQITEEGKIAVMKEEEAFAHIAEVVESGLSEAEISQLRDCLTRIRNNVNEKR